MNRYIFIVAAAYILMFVFTVPFQTPDEPEHFESIIWLSRGVYPKPLLASPNRGGLRWGKLIVRDLIDLYSWNTLVKDKSLKPDFSKIANSPLQKISAKKYVEDRKNIPPVSTQSYHPPLYHLTGALFYKTCELLNCSIIQAYYFTRLTSLLFFFGLLFIVYRLFNNWYLWSIFSLSPLLLRMSVGINNDIAVTFFSVLAIYLLTKIRFADKWNAIVLGVIVGAAIMSKLSGLFLIVPILFTLFIRTNLFTILFFIFTLVIVILPWFLINFNLYHQLVPTYALSVICKPVAHVPIWQIPINTLLEFRHTFYHFAGFYGWNEVYPPKLVFTVYGLVFTLSVIGGIVVSLSSSGLTRGSKIIKLDSRRSLPRTPLRGGNDRELGKDTIIYIICILSLLGFLAAMFIWNLLNGGYCDIQGRYLLPVFVLLVYFQSYFLNRKSLFIFSILYLLASIFFVLVSRYY